MSYELPQGWAWAKMLDILDYEGGSQPPKKEFAYKPREGYVRLVQIRDFGDKPLPTYVADSKRLKKASRDDLLLARYGGSSGSDSLGRICTGLDGAYNVALAKLIFPRDLLEKDYVRYLFLGPWFREKVSRNSRSCQTGFNREDVQDILFPIAPLAEQRRVVAKLDKLLGKVDACQQRLAKIPALLKRFRQTVLAAACSGRLTADWREENSNHAAPSSLLDEIGKRRKEIWAAQRKAKGLVAKPADYPEPVNPTDEFEFGVPELWERCSMDALTSVITSGSRDWKQYYRDDGSGTFIMAQNVRPLRFDRSYRLAVAPPENDRDRARSEVFKDDLLVTIVGANTGDCCRVPEKLGEHYVCQSVALMRPLLPTTSRFLELFLNSTGHGLVEWRKWIYGEGRPHLSFDNLRETSVCLPPLAEQQEIVRRVEALFALADQIEARYAKAKAHVEKLTPSLLARAFHGELVPQDPNDEPASILLESIRQTKSNDQPKRKTKHAALVSH